MDKKIKNSPTFKITTAAILFALIIVMQLIKNISAFISGPVINAAMVIAITQLGTWWGVGFSIIVPVSALIISPASPIVMLAGATHYLTLPIIIIGNLLLVFAAKLGSKKGIVVFIISLIIGAVLKWLFMWGCGNYILLPLFSEKLGKLAAVVTKVFSTLQLYSGLLSVILIVPIQKALDKIYGKNDKVRS